MFKKEEKFQRELRRKELRNKPEVQQWLKTMVRRIHETEVKVTVDEFNKINSNKLKQKQEPVPLFSFTLGAYDDKSDGTRKRVIPKKP